MRGAPFVVHFSNQTPNFKAFNLNELSAVLVILADCEFVCTQKDCGFPLKGSHSGTPRPCFHSCLAGGSRKMGAEFDIFVTMGKARMLTLETVSQSWGF
jgi:hypothetical protein